jgi:hypothetical protein
VDLLQSEKGLQAYHFSTSEPVDSALSKRRKGDI